MSLNNKDSILHFGSNPWPSKLEVLSFKTRSTKVTLLLYVFRGSPCKFERTHIQARYRVEKQLIP